MTELVTWYRAQLAEDERRAERVREVYADEEFSAPATVINAGALVDPVRVLADVAANRRIVALYEHKAESMALYPNQGNAGGLSALTDVLRLLAFAYADRPGYREEWKP